MLVVATCLSVALVYAHVSHVHTGNVINVIQPYYTHGYVSCLRLQYSCVDGTKE